MRQKQLSLYFYGNIPELSKSEFFHPTFNDGIQECIRGKDSRGLRGAGSFQWSKGVQALCQLILRHKLSHEGVSHISGIRGSYAASLDNALQKRSIWLTDFFGADSNGNALAARFIHRSNPGLRRPGPVYLSLLASAVPRDSIAIYSNDIELKTRAEFEGLLALIDEKKRQPPNLQLISNG